MIDKSLRLKEQIRAVLLFALDKHNDLYKTSGHVHWPSVIEDIMEIIDNN